MIKNEENKKGTASDIVNNSTEFNASTRPTTFQKMKFRKDAKGNLILKKKIQIKKTKHHAYFIDKIDSKKSLVTIIEIESYKKYNLDNEDEIEENNDTTKEEEKQLISDAKIEKSKQCCCVLF